MSKRTPLRRLQRFAGSALQDLAKAQGHINYLLMVAGMIIEDETAVDVELLHLAREITSAQGSLKKARAQLLKLLKRAR